VVATWFTLTRLSGEPTILPRNIWNEAEILSNFRDGSSDSAGIWPCMWKEKRILDVDRIYLCAGFGNFYSAPDRTEEEK
jgi:hypothetical protein